MSVLDKVQVVNSLEGKPEYALIPYDVYLQIKAEFEDKEETVYFPHEVIGLEIEHENIVKAWRLYKKMTQKELAQKMGITQAALSQMEKPNATPQRATLEKLAEALGVDVEQLTD